MKSVIYCATVYWVLGEVEIIDPAIGAGGTHGERRERKLLDMKKGKLLIRGRRSGMGDRLCVPVINSGSLVVCVL